jgi:hypothetical protein
MAFPHPSRTIQFIIFKKQIPSTLFIKLHRLQLFLLYLYNGHKTEFSGQWSVRRIKSLKKRETA